MAFTSIEARKSATSFTGGARTVLTLSLVLLLASVAVSQRPYAAVGWGSNSGARLALSTSQTTAGPTLISLSSIVPKGVNGNVKAILGGSDYTTVIMMDDNVISFGDNSNGQLGEGTTSSGAVSPRYLPYFGGAKGGLRTTGYASYLIPPANQAGATYSWGLNKNSVASSTVDSGNAISSPQVFLDPSTSLPVEAAISDMACSTVHCVTLYQNGSLLGIGATSTNSVLSVLTDLILPCNSSSTTSWCPFTISSVVDTVDTPSLIAAGDSITAIVTVNSNILVMGSLVGTLSLPTLSNTSLLNPSLISIPAIIRPPVNAPVSAPVVPVSPVAPVTAPIAPVSATPALAPVSVPPTAPSSSSIPSLAPIPTGGSQTVENLLPSILKAQNIDESVLGINGERREQSLLTPHSTPASTPNVVPSILSLIPSALSNLANVFRVISVDSLHTSCQPASQGSINQIVAGSSFVLFLCNNSRVFGFGQNDLAQINPLAATVISATSPVEVDFSVLDASWYSNSSNRIVKIAAGPNTGYALTSGGKILSWGDNTDQAKGIISGAPSGIADLLNTSYSTLSTAIPVGHTIVDISAHVSAIGAFVRTAEIPGTNCPAVPDMSFMYCSPSGKYTFGAGAVSTGSVALPASVIMSGNMTFNGTADISMPYGMVLEGVLDIAQNAKMTMSGTTSVVGDVTIEGDADVVLSNGKFEISSGSLSLASSTSLTLKNMNFTNGNASSENGSASASIVVSGSASIDGTVTVVIPSSAVDAILNAGSNGQNKDVQFYSFVIYAAGGINNKTNNSPSSSPSSTKKDDGNTVHDPSSDSPAITANQTAVTIVVSPSTVSSCQKVSTSSAFTNGGLAVLASLDSSDCNTKGGLSRRTLGIILGCTLGAVAIAVATVLLIIYNIDSLRQNIVPYHKARM